MNSEIKEGRRNRALLRSPQNPKELEERRASRSKAKQRFIPVSLAGQLQTRPHSQDPTVITNRKQGSSTGDTLLSRGDNELLQDRIQSSDRDLHRSIRQETTKFVLKPGKQSSQAWLFLLIIRILPNLQAQVVSS